MSEENPNNLAAFENITAISNLNDLFQRFGEADVCNIVESITFDTKSKNFIFHLRKLAKKASDEIDDRHKVKEEIGEKIIKLSKSCKDKYPTLVNDFKEWKVCREALVKILTSSSKNLERNSNIVSSFRIFISAADIIGTILQSRRGLPKTSWANFLMENASFYGIIAIFIEMTVSKKMHNEVKNAIKRDQAIFQNIVQWFKQKEELDLAIRSFFPYGIDKDTVKKIHTSSGDFDEYNKLFMSIVVSNVKKNVKFFKNKEFLQKAERVASSEAGKVWFYSVILEDDPYFKHHANSSLCDDIQALLKISPTENPELYVDASRILPSKVRMKVLLNLLNIFSAGSNLWFGAKPDACDVFQKLAEDTQKEAEKIETIVRLLKPENSPENCL